MAEENSCCVEHLIRTNRVVKTDGGSILCSPCIDEGQRARCSTCGSTWIFIIDESDGSSWEKVVPKRKAVRHGNH